MKKIKNYLQISLILLFLSSCSNDNAVEDTNFEENQNTIIKTDNPVYKNQNYSESEINIYKIKRIYYDKATNQEIPISFRIGLSEGSDNLQFFDISDNILKLKGITKAELEAELINVANGGDDDDDDDPNDGLLPHAKCIETCKDKHKKGEGRGSCKANCWVDTGIKILTLGLVG
ncbi:hypothetical protein [Mesonia aestuariivivens]|uniref:Lipoprotein n=1 Tax=Mesonia aestuariivivens TaxID=2796128 RepID=A0ABS6W5D7_9FLAO|nr:hypothetical protein [Mesonia aestuariivivens]MBW2963024.1 hypothetical protein [Mesonia aestuariivivens]